MVKLNRNVLNFEWENTNEIYGGNKCKYSK